MGSWDGERERDTHRKYHYQVCKKKNQTSFKKMQSIPQAFNNRRELNENKFSFRMYKFVLCSPRIFFVCIFFFLLVINKVFLLFSFCFRRAQVNLFFFHLIDFRLFFLFIFYFNESGGGTEFVFFLFLHAHKMTL